MPATRLLRFNGESVAPCRRPVTRPMTTKRIAVRVSSLARARSSHRANRNCREPAPAAVAVRAQSKPHGTPAAPPKRFSPSPSKKRSRVAAPWPDCFQFSTRAPHLPRAPFRIVNRPAFGTAHPLRLERHAFVKPFKPSSKRGLAPLTVWFLFLLAFGPTRTHLANMSMSVCKSY
jgi:hypothetical protein